MAEIPDELILQISQMVRAAPANVGGVQATVIAYDIIEAVVAGLLEPVNTQQFMHPTWQKQMYVFRDSPVQDQQA